MTEGVTAYSKTGALDEDAIFAVENEIGTTIFLANKVATVSVGGGAYSFRNAPHFVPLTGPYIHLSTHCKTTGKTVLWRRLCCGPLMNI